MKRLITIAGIIILSIFTMVFFSSCDINSPFIDVIQEKLDADTPDTTYTVTYAINGATSGTAPSDSNSYEEGDIVTVLGNTGNLVKTGYTFVGWNTGEDGSGTTDYSAGVTFIMGAADVTLYATWMNDIISQDIGLLKVVPAGSFQRDSTVSNISTVTTAFHMSEKEITRAQFLDIMGKDPVIYPTDYSAYSSGLTDPVMMANWYHTISFCNKLSIKEGLTPVYSVTGVNFDTLVFDNIPTTSNTDWDAATANWSANGYRLPTEMEWMWAAMGAVDDYTKPFAGSDGSNIIGDYAWYYDNSSNKTHQAGSKLPNELGLYDMSGNVWEWNWDWYASYPSGTITSDSAAGRGAASGTYRVLRGGSWYDGASYCTVAYRISFDPYNQLNSIGFRVVCP